MYHGIHEKGMLDFTLQWQNSVETGKYISSLPVPRDVTFHQRASKKPARRTTQVATGKHLLPFQSN